MTTKIEEIKKWEKVEVERSASEAKNKNPDDLRISEKIIERYSNPPSDTPFALEYAYHLLGDVKDKKVLDYGCGSGENCVLLASYGANAIGIVVSPELVELAEYRIHLHQLEEKAEFRVGSAHTMPLDDESIDVVFGMAILHHLDLELSSKEVFRVLKKGGRAIFLEPVRNSKFVWFIRNLIPYQAPDVSPYERPLTDSELKNFAADFSSYKSRPFALPFVNLIEILGFPEKIHHAAIKYDGKLLRKKSFLNNYATVRVVEMVK